MAVTIKAMAKRAMRALNDLLAQKELSQALRSQVQEVETALGKTWGELADEASLDPAESAKHQPRINADGADKYGSIQIAEAANVGQWFEGYIHKAFTMAADGHFMDGLLTREERIALSSAIGEALDAFVAKVTAVAPQLYTRGPMEEPGEGVPVGEMEPMEEAANKERSQGDTEEELIERGEVVGEAVELVERAVRPDGTMTMRIIQPGWGSSGYYPAEVLERDGPKVFKAGTKMYWNHPTDEEEAARPEGDLRNLAAELVSDARWDTQRPEGAGLYAEAKVFGTFQGAVEELAPHIGVSIRAAGRGELGTMEGKRGTVIKQITQARSVDFVTMPGAGGQVVSLFEAKRNQPRINTDKSGSKRKQEEEMEELEEAKQEITTLKETMATLNKQLLEREAADFASERLGKVDELPEAARARVLREAVKMVPLAEGKLDEPRFEEVIQDLVKAELAYLAEATGAGQVRGMGRKEPGSGDSDSLASLEESFRAMGLDEKRAKEAAKGRS